MCGCHVAGRRLADQETVDVDTNFATFKLTVSGAVLCDISAISVIMFDMYAIGYYHFVSICAVIGTVCVCVCARAGALCIWRVNSNCPQLPFVIASHFVHSLSPPL